MSKRRSRHKRRSTMYDFMDDKIIEFEKYYGQQPRHTLKKPNIKLKARSLNQSDYIDLLINPANAIVFACGGSRRNRQNNVSMFSRTESILRK